LILILSCKLANFSEIRDRREKIAVLFVVLKFYGSNISEIRKYVLVIS